MTSQPFHIMAKPNGPKCNLDCSYCFYLEKERLYPGRTDFRMSRDVLESFIRQKIAAQPIDQVTFAWQGGEPTLLGLDFFREIVELQTTYAAGKKIENTLQTNGILLDDDWCIFFRENNFLIGLSIDGPEERHNRYRLNKGGSGTFNRVIKGLDCLKKHGVAFNTLTVVQRDNSFYPLAVYRFLKETGSDFIQFIPIVERQTRAQTKNGITLISPDHTRAAELTPWSVESEQYGQFLCEIFDEWVRKDVGKYYIQIFDVALEAWTGQNPGLCVFSETCGQALALEHNGDLYSCDHYVYPENKLGNIMAEALETLVGSEQQKKFGSDKKDRLPRYCLNCEVRFVCNGECPKHRFIKTPDGEAGLNYLCSGYKMFFKHIDPYMRFMANELHHRRAAAHVMAWVQEKDAGFASFKPGVNDPCPCGSGKKYKKCCAKI
jgi:uncharacterized protein